MASEDVTLKIALKDAISSGLGGIQSKLAGIVKGFVAFDVGRRVLVNLYDETQKYQAQMIDLRSAIERTGAEWGKAAPKIDAFVEKMESQKGVVDDYTRGALQRAIDFTHDLGKAQDVVSLAADIAAAKHIDLEQATNLLGKAYRGNITMLTRMLPELKDVIKEGATLEDIMKALAYYQGAAEKETGKLSTKFALMWDALGDINLALGKLVGGDKEGGGLIGWLATGVIMVAKGLSYMIDDLRWLAKSMWDLIPSMESLVTLFTNPYAALFGANLRAIGDASKDTTVHLNAQGESIKMLSAHSEEWRKKREEEKQQLLAEKQGLADYAAALRSIDDAMRAIALTEYESDRARSAADKKREAAFDAMSPGVPDLEADVDK